MEITSKEIRHLANLSALNFTDEEIEKFKGEFQDILNLINQIDEANIEEELEYKVKSFEELRDDEVKNGLTQEKVLENAPSKRLGSFSVPLMME